MTTGMIIWGIGALACLGFLIALHDLSDREDSFTDFLWYIILSALLWPAVVGSVIAFILADTDLKKNEGMK